MKNSFFLMAATFLVFNSVIYAAEPLNKKCITNNPGNSINAVTIQQQKQVASASVIFARKQVAILCYHHIRALAPGKKTRDYEVVPADFAAQMKALSDNGYKTILPDQLYNYLAFGGPLPAKPVMITFDDTDEEQFTIGKKELDKYNFKGVFFVMTVSMNRPHYLTTAQIKQLAAEGNVVSSHTWDHHMVTKYNADDWVKQLVKPRKKLEDIIGQKIDYFAYPFGLWNDAAIKKLKESGFKLAFALTSKRSVTDPLFTVRRTLVPGNWSVKQMLAAMVSYFH